MSIGMIHVTDEVRAAVLEWLPGPPDLTGADLVMCVGETGDPRGFCKVSLGPGAVTLAYLSGTDKGCRYILRLCEELAVCRATMLVCHPATDLAAAAALAEGYEVVGGAVLIRVPLTANPKPPEPKEGPGLEPVPEKQDETRKPRKRGSRGRGRGKRTNGKRKTTEKTQGVHGDAGDAGD